MLTVGGTLVAPESTSRNGISTDAWRPEAQPGIAARAEAIRSEGVVRLPDRPSRARDPSRRDLVPPGGAVRRAPPGADAAASAHRRRGRRCRRAIHRLRRQRARGRLPGRRAARRPRIPPGAVLSPFANRRPGAETVAGRVEMFARRGADIAQALAAGADPVGVARPLIADPDMPAKVLAGREASIRSCVACNEDCRAFDPVLLCSVNPDLARPGEARRPAAPLVVQRAGGSGGGPVAIVGAGPAGLECALRLAREREVVLFDERDAIGGELAVTGAPQRARLGIAPGLLPPGRSAQPPASSCGSAPAPAPETFRTSRTSCSPSAARRCCPISLPAGGR
jgi:hypothetical protein